MRYIFHLVGRQVRFTHAGQGTSNLSEIGTKFKRVRRSVLQDKNIFMYRNALDTAVSLYFQIHKKDFAGGDLFYYRAFVKLLPLNRLPPKDIDLFVVHPVWGVENICRFNRAWLDFLEGQENALIMNYEDAMGDAEATIARLCRFIEVEGFNIQELIEKSNFESMKTMELSGGKKGLALSGFQSGDPESLKVRRGVVKGYAKYLDPDTVAKARGIASKYGFEI